MFNISEVDNMYEQANAQLQIIRQEINKLDKYFQNSTISVQVNMEDITESVKQSVSTISNNLSDNIYLNADSFKSAIISEIGCAAKDYFKALREFALRKGLVDENENAIDASHVPMSQIVYAYCRDNAGAKEDFVQVLQSIQNL